MAAPHWTQAEEASRAAGLELRPLTELGDADRILEVMITTWGEHQLLPSELIRALQESGNVPYGAFRAEEMIGYVLGFIGSDEGGLHVHSHMLAVRPGLRSRGVGHALKLAQRAQALDAGVRVVRWTFDPLLSRNAHFNFGKLGAVADRFHRDFYGEMTDTLNRGDRSDRLVVRWDLDEDRGRPVMRQPSGRSKLILRRGGDSDAPRPERIDDPKIEGNLAGAIVHIPADYPSLRERVPEVAREWRAASADALEACFGAGMVAAGFERESFAYHFVAGSDLREWRK